MARLLASPLSRTLQPRRPDRCASLPPTTEDHDAEMDAIAGELEAAGLLALGTDAEGHITYTLTREGKAIGRQLAMTQSDDARLTIINELLEESTYPVSGVASASTFA